MATSSAAKYTFLVTILIMGASTFLVGCLPTYAQIGWIAPVALIVLRMAQGLALGGEYGGAATYVAEHAPMGRRGFYTAFIQTTATLGLLLSLLIIMFTQIYVNANYPSVPALGPDGAAVLGPDGRPTVVTRVQRLGLAHPVPGLDPVARDLRLDPAADAREPGLREDEGGGHAVQGAAFGGVRPVA